MTMPEGHDSPNPKKKSGSIGKYVILFFVLGGVVGLAIIWGVDDPGNDGSGNTSVSQSFEKPKLEVISCPNKNSSFGHVKASLTNMDSSKRNFNVILYLVDGSGDMIDFQSDLTGYISPNETYYFDRVFFDLSPHFTQCGIRVTSID